MSKPNEYFREALERARRQAEEVDRRNEEHQRRMREQVIELEMRRFIDPPTKIEPEPDDFDPFNRRFTTAQAEQGAGE